MARVVQRLSATARARDLIQSGFDGTATAAAATSTAGTVDRWRRTAGHWTHHRWIGVSSDDQIAGLDANTSDDRVGHQMMVMVIQMVVEVMVVVVATQQQMMILQTLVVADRVVLILGVATSHGRFHRFVVRLVVARFRVVLRQLMDNRWQNVIGVMRDDQTSSVATVRHQRMLRRVVVIVRSVVPVALLPHRIR